MLCKVKIIVLSPVTSVPRRHQQRKTRVGGWEIRITIIVETEGRASERSYTVPDRLDKQLRMVACGGKSTSVLAVNLPPRSLVRSATLIGSSLHRAPPPSAVPAQARDAG